MRLTKETIEYVNNFVIDCPICGDLVWATRVYPPKIEQEKVVFS